MSNKEIKKEDIWGWNLNVSKEILESLRQVIDYTYHDEEEHYEQFNKDALESDHIFPHIVILNKWYTLLCDMDKSTVVLTHEDMEMSDSQINSQENELDYALGLIPKCGEE